MFDVIRMTFYAFYFFQLYKSEIGDPKSEIILPFQPVQHVNIYRVCIAIDHYYDG
jgi:hypothetical protein